MNLERLRNHFESHFFNFCLVGVNSSRKQFLDIVDGGKHVLQARGFKRVLENIPGGRG